MPVIEEIFFAQTEIICTSGDIMDGEADYELPSLVKEIDNTDIIDPNLIESF